MHYTISTEFLITLFGFLFSLAFNNRIENLTLITKFRGPLFSGGLETVPLLSAGRAGPGTVYFIKLYNTVFISVMYLLYCNSSYYYIYINFNVDILPCLFDSIIKLF